MPTPLPAPRRRSAGGLRPLLAFAGLELRYHLRRPVNYLFMLVMLLGGWLYTATPIAWAGGFGGAILVNAPAKINAVVMFMTVVGTIFTSAIAGAAMLRDFEFRTHELLFTTPLRKTSFVLGRFLGAYLVTALVFACSALGLWLGAHMPWIDPAALGPESAGLYLRPIALYVLPNAAILCALFLAVGVLTRSFVAVSVQGMTLFLAWQLGTSMLDAAWRSTPALERVAASLDPFGMTATQIDVQHWTIAEQNTRLLGLSGLLLWNRLLWLAVAGLVLLVAYRRFGMEAFPGVRRRARAVEAPIAGDPYVALRPIPPAEMRRGAAATWRAFAAMTRLYVLDIARARPFQALVAVLLIFLVSITHANWQLSSTLPVTHAVLLIVEEFGLFFSLLLAVYAGELVWRERGLRCDGIHDATPVSSAAVIAAKIAALLLIQIGLLSLLLGFGVAYQALQGYTRFELSVYLGHLVGLGLAEHALTIFLAVFLQLVLPRKHLGSALLILYYAAFGLIDDLGVEHRLVRYADLPEIVYSDMNGFGPRLGMFVCLFFYWAAFAMLLLAIGHLLQVRGAPAGLRARLRAARSRATGRWWAFTGLAGAAWLGLGAYAYESMHVRNTYRTARAADELAADYERAFKQYESQPQPRITALDVHVDLSPETATARARGSLRLDNPYDVAIEAVHLVLPEELTVHAIAFADGAALEREDPRVRYQIWRLAAPLAPGAATTLTFDVGAERTGFAHDERATEIHANGTYVHANGYFRERQLLPRIGYQRKLEVADRDARERLGLPERSGKLPIDDPLARGGAVLRHSPAWIDVATSVCTAPDQIAVAGGSLVRTWEQDGRRCFAYALDARSVDVWALVSARYAVVRERHAGVDLEVYHHPEHADNVATMTSAMKRSLDVYQAAFGPYQFRQLRVVEHPRYLLAAESFPGIILYSEGAGFILKFDPTFASHHDNPFSLTAHEVAHQWWAHQVSARDVQGATLLIESLAEYSAHRVVARTYGPAAARGMRRHNLGAYLLGRSQERQGERPLARAEDQPYIHYGKGMLALVGLADLVGEGVVEAALARFARAYRFRGPPLPIADDLLAIFREVTPPEYHYFITDSFETITLYDNRICGASVTEEGERFRVRFRVCASKVRADEHGRETPAPLADHLDVGVFAADPQGSPLGRPLWLERRVVRSTSADDPSAALELDVVVDERPAVVGVDPYLVRIDRNPDDNLAPL